MEDKTKYYFIRGEVFDKLQNVVGHFDSIIPADNPLEAMEEFNEYKELHFDSYGNAAILEFKRVE